MLDCEGHPKQKPPWHKWEGGQCDGHCKTFTMGTSGHQRRKQQIGLDLLEAVGQRRQCVTPLRGPGLVACGGARPRHGERGESVQECCKNKCRNEGKKSPEAMPNAQEEESG